MPTSLARWTRRHFCSATLGSGWALTQPMAWAGERWNVEVVFTQNTPPALQYLCERWIERSAQAVQAYLGRFPFSATRLIVSTSPGEGVQSGLTFDGPPPTVRVRVGLATSEAQLRDDGVMVHEMLHLALPELPRQHNWFHEGVATYAEIMARAQARYTSPALAWQQLWRGLPKGLPLPGDNSGLDGHQAWGRIYWGGTLFCLLADLGLRRQTRNRHGLQDALRALVREGSHYGQSRPLDALLREMDQAAGTPVLTELYGRMKDQPYQADLAALWQELGVQEHQGRLLLLDSAPGAAMRRAIDGST